MTFPPIYPVDSHGLIRRESALRAGFSDNQLNSAVTRGGLIRLTPGVFVEPRDDVETAVGRDELYRLRCIAAATAATAAGGGDPLSHISAAALHGLPLLHPDQRLVHSTSGRGSGGSIRAHRHTHTGVLAPDELTRVDGMGDFAQALTVFDAALRRSADVALIRARVDGAHTTGIRIARRALGHATGLSESVGESWSRAQIIEAGLPVPTLQRRYRGSSTYFCDFDWDGVLVGEFDGMTKYSRLLRPGQTIADAVAREKAREDELRALGLMVLRWTWSTLVRGELVELLTPWLIRLGITGT